MKVNEFRNQNKLSSKRSKTDKTARLDIAGRKFSDYVEESSRLILVEELNELLSEVEHFGAEFEKKLTIDSLLKYKGAVSHLMRSFIDKGLELKKIDIFASGTGRDIYTIIKKVDSKLDEMTRKFLADQKDRLSVLTIIDEIRGLLLDVLT